MQSDTHQKNSAHYDSVVHSWQSLMGDNFHWGYFADRGLGLDDATAALVELLASFLPLVPTHRVLDIGCGIGEPATLLHQRFGCQVVGISNSPQGIRRASELAKERGLENAIRFHVRDALDNQFPDCSFDHAWLMEMSHLIQDKRSLIREAARCVVPGGKVALCDLTFNRRPLPREIFAHLEDHRVLKRAFGEAQLETLDVYQSIFESVGLVDVKSQDISREVIPTLQFWKENAMEVKSKTSDQQDLEALDDFAKSCDILTRFYDEGTWGYGCIVGTRV